MVVVQAQVVELVPEVLGAKLLAHDIARQTRVPTELPAARAAPEGGTLPVTIVSKTRLPERDYHQQREPHQETGEGWP